ncbi:14825_t:CDS:2 [Funneliformis caledonium]|uniref:14825_t:CDS:1 n=1 Tax=Funneliformis caledonium TaxID=1117310 RepID=A0A9N9DMT1_9GLOM|nr:14825_t:CDS:2 [Funneliformis caledonium]
MSEYSKKIFRDNLQGLDAYTRHKLFMRDYVNFYGNNGQPSNVETKTEFDILKENHNWEQRVAKKYYDKLFREYCIAELKYYKEGRIALRWRIEKEVITGKGQFICASTKCSNTSELKSWEVNFAYMEDGEKKNALVKIRLCPKCSNKLNYSKQHSEIKTEKEVNLEEKEIEQETRHEKRKREDYESSNSDKKKKRESTSERSKKEREGNSEDIESQKLESVDNNPDDLSERGKIEDFDEFFTGLFV